MTANCHIFGVKIRRLYISPGHNFFGHHGLAPGENPVVEMAEVECVAGRGIRGDRFFDFKENYQGQITFFFAVKFSINYAWELKLTGKSPGFSRRNVIVSGVDLDALIGNDFEIQGVRFRGTAECSPCHWMDMAFAPGAETFLRGRGGLRAQILTDGKLCAGTCHDL